MTAVFGLKPRIFNTDRSTSAEASQQLVIGRREI